MKEKPGAPWWVSVNGENPPDAYCVTFSSSPRSKVFFQGHCRCFRTRPEARSFADWCRRKGMVDVSIELHDKAYWDNFPF